MNQLTESEFLDDVGLKKPDRSLTYNPKLDGMAYQFSFLLEIYPQDLRYICLVNIFASHVPYLLTGGYSFFSARMNLPFSKTPSLAGLPSA